MSLRNLRHKVHSVPEVDFVSNNVVFRFVYHKHWVIKFTSTENQFELKYEYATSNSFSNSALISIDCTQGHGIIKSYVKLRLHTPFTQAFYVLW